MFSPKNSTVFRPATYLPQNATIGRSYGTLEAALSGVVCFVYEKPRFSELYFPRCEKNIPKTYCDTMFKDVQATYWVPETTLLLC